MKCEAGLTIHGHLSADGHIRRAYWLQGHPHQTNSTFQATFLPQARTNYFLTSLPRVGVSFICDLIL